MFQRLWAVIRSFFGFFLRRTEDPELLLQQYIDDIRTKLPKLRATVADVMATEIQLQQQVDRLKEQVEELDRQIIAAVKLGPQYEEEAKTLIAAKATAEENLEDTLAQLETAKKASRSAKAALEDYQREMEKKITEAKRLLSQAKLAKMQNELAQTMAAFEVGQPSDILERMREKVEERMAKARARVEVASVGLDSRLREIKRASARIGVDEQLAEYKRQLGMLPAPEIQPTEKTMRPILEQQSKEPPS